MTDGLAVGARGPDAPPRSRSLQRAAAVTAAVTAAAVAMTLLAAAVHLMASAAHPLAQVASSPTSFGARGDRLVLSPVASGAPVEVPRADAVQKTAQPLTGKPQLLGKVVPTRLAAATVEGPGVAASGTSVPSVDGGTYWVTVYEVETSGPHGCPRDAPRRGRRRSSPAGTPAAGV